MRPNLTVSLGLRYETQTNISDWRDFAPRIGVAWAPGARGGRQPKTVIRGGSGFFYTRFDNSYALDVSAFNGDSGAELQHRQSDVQLPESGVLTNNPTFLVPDRLRPDRTALDDSRDGFEPARAADLAIGHRHRAAVAQEHDCRDDLHLFEGHAHAALARHQRTHRTRQQPTALSGQRDLPLRIERHLQSEAVDGEREHAGHRAPFRCSASTPWVMPTATPTASRRSRRTNTTSPVSTAALRWIRGITFSSAAM